jgi:hypothetical protein
MQDDAGVGQRPTRVATRVHVHVDSTRTNSLGHCRTGHRVNASSALFGKGNEVWRHLQKWFDNTGEIDDQCGGINGGLDDRHCGRHHNHASTVNAEYPQYLVTRTARGSHEQSAVIDRPTQLSNPLVLAGLAT